MKISPKKKGEIYDLIHRAISDKRIELRTDYLKEGFPLRDKIDYLIGQLEVPLAQSIIKLLEGKSHEQD